MDTLELIAYKLLDAVEREASGQADIPAIDWVEDWRMTARQLAAIILELPLPVHVAVGENLSRCGVVVGDRCPACHDPAPRKPSTFLRWVDRRETPQ